MKPGLWFVFEMTVDPVAGVRQPTRNRVPASSALAAREKMRSTVDPALRERVNSWPLVEVVTVQAGVIQFVDVEVSFT